MAGQIQVTLVAATFDEHPCIWLLTEHGRLRSARRR
jgi:hypothetical protein